MRLSSWTPLNHSPRLELVLIIQNGRTNTQENMMIMRKICNESISDKLYFGKRSCLLSMIAIFYLHFSHIRSTLHLRSFPKLQVITLPLLSIKQTTLRIQAQIRAYTYTFRLMALTKEIKYVSIPFTVEPGGDALAVARAGFFEGICRALGVTFSAGIKILASTHLIIFTRFAAFSWDSWHVNDKRDFW